MFNEFKKFLLRGNVVDLAVGVVIGGAFGTVVHALVTGLLTPIISLFSSSDTYFYDALTFTIHGVEFSFGNLVDALISFVIISAAVFFLVVKPMNVLIAKAHKEPPAEPSVKKCPECLSEMDIKARRCPHCTQVVA